MKDLIKTYRPTPGSDACSHSSTMSPLPLTYEEKNALRFIAGYVSRKIYKKVQESFHPACIKEMIRGCSEHDSDDNTYAWPKTINRGGLWHVNQELYVLFKLIEEHI